MPNPPVIYQGCAYHVMRAPVPHWNGPQRTSTIATEDFVLIESTGRVLQDVCLHGGFAILHLYLVDSELRYLVMIALLEMYEYRFQRPVFVGPWWMPTY